MWQNLWNKTTYKPSSVEVECKNYLMKWLIVAQTILLISAGIRATVDKNGGAESEDDFQMTNQEYIKMLKGIKLNFAAEEKVKRKNFVPFDWEMAEDTGDALNTTYSISDTQLNYLKSVIRFAAVASCPKSTVKHWECGARCNNESTKNTKVIKVFDYHTTKTSGYIAVNHEKKLIIIAFRGSARFQNWINNIQIAQVDMQLEISEATKKAFPDSENVRVHSGFFKTYSVASEEIKKISLSLLKKYADYHLVCTGHSLGGALAVFAAIDIKEMIIAQKHKNVERVSAITVGEPRIGNEAFSEYFAYLFPTNIASDTPLHKINIRIVNNFDAVPHLAPSVLGFSHRPTELWVIPNFEEDELTSYDQSTDPNLLTKLICPSIIPGSIENEFCSWSASPFSMNLVNHYFIWDIIFGPECTTPEEN